MLVNLEWKLMTAEVLIKKSKYPHSQIANIKTGSDYIRSRKTNFFSKGSSFEILGDAVKMRNFLRRGASDCYFSHLYPLGR